MNKSLKYYVPLAFLVLGILSSCGGGGGGSSVVAPTMTVTTAVPVFSTTAITSTVFSTTAMTTAISDYTVTLQAANAITGTYNTAAAVGYNNDYGLSLVGARHAYERGYFGQGVTVALYGEGMRTAHIDLTANLLPGVHYNTDGITNTVDAITDDSDSFYDIRPSDTFAAGIIAAAAGNTLAHGVAPEASIIPLKGGLVYMNYTFLGLAGSFRAIAPNAFSYAVDNGASILNNSWNASPHYYDYLILGAYNGVLTFSNTIALGDPIDIRFYTPAFFDVPYAFSFLGAGTLDISDNFSEITAAITTADMVMVWGAGDFGWNEETGRIILSGSRDYYDQPYMTLAVTSFLNGFSYRDDYVGTTFTTISLATLSLDINFAGGYAHAPLYEPSLLGRWAHAVAVDRNSVIASFSNACGTDTKYWCLAAPGVDLTGLDRDSDDGIIIESGTGYSAAYVSGALAVLKSRLPDMPMSVILALLFHTATDLSVGDEDDGVDDVYGHGLVNLSAAINLQDDVSLVLSTYNTVTTSVTSAVTTTITVTASMTSAVTTAMTSAVTSTMTSAVTTAMTSAVTTTMTSAVTTTMTSAVTTTMTTAVTTAMTTTMTSPVTVITAMTNTVFSTAAITTTISDYTVNLQAANTITGTYDTAAAGYNNDYGLAQIGAHHAYERGYFGQGVTVAVFGEGIRTTHIDLTANLLPGVYYNQDGSISSLDIEDGSSNVTAERTHGYDTFGAGIIGAANNATANGGGIAHGVAPSVSMLPLRGGYGDKSSPVVFISAIVAAFSHAATSSVHIIHNGWNHNYAVYTDNGNDGRYNGSDLGGSSGARVYLPLLSGLPVASIRDIGNHFSQITAAISTADMAVVWAAGDFGWNTETGEVALVANASFPIPASLVLINDFLSGYSFVVPGMTTRISLATLSLDPNFAGGYALGPTYEPSLLGRWAHAVAVDSSSVIASFSNACGTDTKYWCLAAPGVGLTGLDRNSNDGYEDDYDSDYGNNGTAYAAAYVSGALAVLKSRLPDMPMSVILALLFETATDLGADGVDDIYGHGLLNLEKAITVQGDIALAIPIPYSVTTSVTSAMTSTMSTAVTTTSTVSTAVTTTMSTTVTSAISTAVTSAMSTTVTSAMSTTVTSAISTTVTSTMFSTMAAAASANNNLLQSKSKVSPLLAALKEQLSEVSAAVEFLPGYYYNTPLGALIEVSETDSNLSKLGGAASAMLSQTQSREMGFGLSVLENKGTLLEVSHKTEFGRFTYDICTYCETSLWEEEQTNATPFFASNRPQMSYAAKLGSGDVEIFAATGIEDTTTSNDYQQYGIRLNLGVPKSEFGNAESGFLEFSRTTEEDTLYGGEYSGAFALSGSETYQGRLHTERAFTDNWRGLADYQFGWTNSEAQGGGLITDISRLRFDGYRIGVEGSSLFGVPFGGGGLMRFGITRQSGIRSGTIRLRYGVATTSEFIEDYQYALNNGYEIVEREFSLATKPTTLYHWGYTFAPRAQMQAAFGLEYNATANDNDSAAAASLVLNWSY